MRLDMNDCKFIGRLVANPSVVSLPGGKMVTKFTLAVNSDRRNKEGAVVNEEVAFIDCEVWDKAAEIIGVECNKGTKLMVEARAKTESWTDKQSGQKRSALRFRVNRFYFMESKAKLANKENEYEYDPYKNPNVGAEVTDGAELPF